MTKDEDPFEQTAIEPRAVEITEEEIDQNLMGTFPASDSPSWTLGVERRSMKPASASIPEE